MDMQDEKIIELSKKQMEKVTGGGQWGTDCFLCPGHIDEEGTPCQQPLRQVNGRLYRCFNPPCDLLGKDQFPSVKTFDK